MYFYKLYYSDGSYSSLASKKPICNPKWISETCIKVEIKSTFWYFKEWLAEKYLNRKQKFPSS